ncbi:MULTISPECIES: hypothetical protein [Rhodococcus]|uniref:hypothetical protein n=1 Tax=Rhodococcus TaxID=1827 RepID=UPI00295431B7|nr:MULTISPECIES: hypothetical protein [Rhodococcus]MDV7246354.1 hypothetical protein [Rhodococcus oxybenzonivorans]MDV7337364.1 hypothetical protein [Rhodococcus oxybenzonivorans]MDV7347993.1 hypothetical protein [Rhodococcus oxybenzonivorans]MDV8031645.1 hypothetical protein [Rhodococcus sp. IEGM 27]
MKARKLVIVVLVVAVVGLLTYTYLFRTSNDGDSASVAPSTLTSVPSTTAAAATPVDAEATELPTASRAAEQAARQGLTVAFTWYPATDITQNDAYGRARNWLTAKLADRMLVDARTERGPGVQWDEWAQQQAKVIADVSIECSGCPEDTDTLVHRVATIKQTAISGNSTDSVKPDTTVWVILVREGDRWLIDDIRY